MEINKYYAEKVKEYRLNLNLTQTDVSETLGYTSSQLISRVERGECRYPIKSLIQLSEIFKVSHSELIDLEVESHRNKIIGESNEY